jgi:hypothetical protein
MKTNTHWVPVLVGHLYPTGAHYGAEQRTKIAANIPELY